ncbi:hypothetical protein KP509_38G052600 [Ceratopteris richardii]|uniref:Pentatricopeptide repeat-containing protein n=1 Tax=Ceratopteris richardii TaxID=49495 RepID=A0A8T2Q4X7_CERRI|nr:hypothetical protein KP509_38G052600 [Ceratopteris richardii]KAH7278691.1 hypothetical protein KP509_38G052600 [Ceratopteris richardii]KAH7278692.1 hypothetical protein KP509_38G052600 [Ceratopteris richardii]
MLENVVSFSSKALCDLLRKSSDQRNIIGCRILHHYIVAFGYLYDVYLPNYLIRGYGSCCCLPDACHIFDSLGAPDAFSWSAIISAYAKHGSHEQVFSLYSAMLRSEVQPDGHVYTAVLNACKSRPHLAQGRTIHEHICRSSYRSDVYINNTLINMYARCGNLNEAQQVFHELIHKDIVTWNTLLTGYAHHRAWWDILLLFNKLCQGNVQPNQVTFVCVLKACASLHNLQLGMLCHCLVVELCLQNVSHINNVLIDVYAKCGSLHEAEKLFAASPKHDVVAWTSIISGYADHGLDEKAFKAYVSMQAKNLRPNEFTYASIIKACSSSKMFVQGRLIHFDIIEGEFFQTSLNNALIVMYSQCGSFHDAWMTFIQAKERDIVSWNSVINACLEHEHAELGLQLFKNSQQMGLHHDSLTIAGAIRACALLSNLREGRFLHALAVESDCSQRTFITNSVLHLYVSCSSLKEARRVFDSISSDADAVTWNVVIGGYVACGQMEEAFKFFDRMMMAGVPASPITLVYVLKACSITSAPEKGRLVHIFVLRSGLPLDAYVGSSFINMYAKCGSLEDAENVLLRLNRSLVPWSAMIAAYAEHSKCREAFVCVEKMQQEGVQLDDVTYVSVLSVCSHAGLHYDGMFPFQRDFRVAPVQKHFNCMVDLFGRLGYLTEAKIAIQNMTVNTGVPSLTSFLSHCRTYTDQGNSLNSNAAC